jgi:hypothetical protein
MKRFFIAFAIMLFSTTIFAQQWGLYTIYCGQNQTTTVIIDTAGTTYKTWTFSNSKKNGYSCYMLENDTLLRSYIYSSNSFSGGGITGALQKVLWDGTVVWDYPYSTSTYCIHHDICPLPNGNVLVIAYDKKTSTQATQAGSSSAIEIWSEKIVELRPTGATTAEVVWEWKVWDHLCQNYNSSKDNYVSSIVANPQLLNINYNTAKDWMHMNGIDYNEELDQIVVSSHNLNEFYVIDHSTTTAEAAGHSGGNSGKGGDILYRWGNPTAYGATGTTNFDVIHDAHWTPSDYAPCPNCIGAMNNEGGTSGKAAIDIVDAPEDGYNYSHTANQAYGPTTYTSRYNTNQSSMGQGNSEQFPNGNMMIWNPSGMSSTIWEINSSGTTLWTKTINQSIPQAHRYEKCYIRPVNASVSASDLIICVGDEAVLTTTATAVTESNPTYTYSWSSEPAGFSSTAANPTITPSVETTYTVIVTNNQSGCADEVSIEISVLAAPEVPVITADENILSSTSAESYQWYFNGTEIDGADSQTYSASQTGNYQVEVWNADGCSSISDNFSFETSDIESFVTTSAQIYPNPNSGEFTIFAEVEFTYQIVSTSGSVIATGENSGTVDMSDFAGGVYYVVIKTEDLVSTQKLIIVK